MPSPYKTNCVDYNKIGCKSRRDCVDQCNVEWALKHCSGSLPSDTIIDRHNDKDIFKDRCNDNHKEYCEQKYKSPNCINEYYTIKLVGEKKIREVISDVLVNVVLEVFNETFKSNKNAKADINLITQIDINFNNEPDIIYIHTPQQYPIEFICLLGGVISLWTGFSVISLFAFGKKFFRRKQNEIKEIKFNVNSVNNKKITSINKNNKMSYLKNVMTMMKILKKKNRVIKITPYNTERFISYPRYQSIITFEQNKTKPNGFHCRKVKSLRN